MNRPPENADNGSVELVLEPVAAAATGELSPAIVGEVINALVKSLRAHQIYQANNPVYQRFVGAVREQFAELWAHTSALHLTVEEQAFRWEGNAFSAGEGRETLAFAFYKDGIRMLSFLPGFEDEVDRFLEVVHRARSSGDQEDLVSCLWEQEFAAFQYGFVDLLSDGLALPESSGNELPPISRSVIKEEVAEGEVAEGEAQPAASAVAESTVARAITRDDFDETLYFLDEHELHALQQEVEREWARDLKKDVLNALFDRLEDAEPDRQSEVLRILRQLLAVSLSHGDIRSAATILRELDVAAGNAAMGEAQRAVVTRLFDELSEPDVLGQLVSLLEGGQIAPQAEELSLFFRHLRPKALPVLVAAAERSEVAGVRERLGAAVDVLVQQNPAEVDTLLASPDPLLARGAARLVGRHKLSGSAPRLGALLQRSEPLVRLAAVEALATMPSGAGIEALLQALEDADREVRMAAVRALAALKYRPARQRLETIIQGRRLMEADLTEKIAYFETYGAIGGADSVELLDKLLNTRGMLRRKQPSDIRACAALGLGKAGTPGAKSALQRAADEQDPVVRSAVLRALRQEPASA